MEGKELNGIYDGYSYMPFYLSHSNASCFQHLYDYEPASKNHWVPNYGLFSRQYFKYQMKSNYGQGEKYSSFKKDHGPPYGHFSQQFDPIDKNEYLLEKGVDIEQLKNAHPKREIEIAHH
jgi:hypothetical protein